MENLFPIPEQEHLYIYDKFKRRIPVNQVPKNLRPLPFYFFGSGSKGNSVYLTRLHTLIDLGFPYNHYTKVNPNFFLDVDYIFLTHEHRDHFKFSTFYKILRVFPNVTFVLTQRMYDIITEPDKSKNKIAKEVSGDFDAKIKSLKTTYASHFFIINKNQPSMIFKTRHQVEFWFTPHIVSHGTIQNLAIEFSTQKYGMHMLYSSDIDHLLDTTGSDQVQHLGLPMNYTTTEDLTDKHFMPHKGALTLQALTNPFNLMFLEANYDENILQPFLSKHPFDPHANGNQRHISEQEAWRYINLALDTNGLFVPLHASTQFGTLIQELD